jgi:hypothetical protein
LGTEHLGCDDLPPSSAADNCRIMAFDPTTNNTDEVGRVAGDLGHSVLEVGRASAILEVGARSCAADCVKTRSSVEYVCDSVCGLMIGSVGPYAQN